MALKSTHPKLETLIKNLTLTLTGNPNPALTPKLRVEHLIRNPIFGLKTNCRIFATAWSPCQLHYNTKHWLETLISNQKHDHEDQTLKPQPWLENLTWTPIPKPKAWILNVKPKTVNSNPSLKLQTRLETLIFNPECGKNPTSAP